MMGVATEVIDCTKPCRHNESGWCLECVSALATIADDAQQDTLIARFMLATAVGERSEMLNIAAAAISSGSERAMETIAEITVMAMEGTSSKEAAELASALKENLEQRKASKAEAQRSAIMNAMLRDKGNGKWHN